MKGYNIEGSYHHFRCSSDRAPDAVMCVDRSGVQQQQVAYAVSAVYIIVIE
jgi:hypothetical protein